MSDKVDYLDEDPVIAEQKYCVVSVLTPKKIWVSNEHLLILASFISVFAKQKTI